MFLGRFGVVIIAAAVTAVCTGLGEDRQDIVTANTRPQSTDVWVEARIWPRANITPENVAALALEFGRSHHGVAVAQMLVGESNAQIMRSSVGILTVGLAPQLHEGYNSFMANLRENQRNAAPTDRTALILCLMGRCRASLADGSKLLNIPRSGEDPTLFQVGSERYQLIHVAAVDSISGRKDLHLYFTSAHERFSPDDLRQLAQRIAVSSARVKQISVRNDLWFAEPEFPVRYRFGNWQRPDWDRYLLGEQVECAFAVGREPLCSGSRFRLR
jgi:hypothetical protein